MKLFPKEYIESIWQYDFEKAYASGKKLILFDIDNTVAPHGAPASEETVKQFLRIKKLGFRFMAISNNNEERVKKFAEKVRADYVFDAEKPSAKGYEEAIKKAGVSKAEALFFGDQIFTDILGANRAGIDCVLVKPIDRKTDEIQIKFKRLLERPVIRAYFRHKHLAINDYFS